MMNLKTLFLALLMTVSTLAAMAHTRVTKGDVKVLDNKEITCDISFDFTNTKVEDIPYKEYLEKRGEPFISEWENEVIPYGTEYYSERWNKENKDGLQVSETAGGIYRMVIAPTYLNLGSSAMSTLIGFGAGGCRFDGTISIYKDEELILEMTVSNQRSKSKSLARNRFRDLMVQLVKDTFKSLGR